MLADSVAGRITSAKFAQHQLAAIINRSSHPMHHVYLPSPQTRRIAVTIL